MTSRALLVALAALTAFGSRQAHADRGGPDQGGWEWRDSEEAGVAFEWVEVPEEARQILELGDDTFSEPIPLGFDFSFYGRTASTVTVGSNGFLSFEEAPVAPYVVDQCPLPHPRLPNRSIYGFYLDLDPTAETSGEVFVATVDDPEAPGARRFVATWSAIDLFRLNASEPSDPVTFQIVLFEASGEIQVNLLESTDGEGTTFAGGRAMIGLEDGLGEVGLGLCAFERALPDRYAVRFVRSSGVGLVAVDREVVATPGRAVTLAFDLVNFSEDAVTATLTVDGPARWTVEGAPAALTVEPDGVESFELTLDIPADAVAEDRRVTVSTDAGGLVTAAVTRVLTTLGRDAWQPVADLPETLQALSVVAADHALFAMGGHHFDWAPVASTFRYDPAANRWSDEAFAELPHPVAYGGACSMNGAVYLVGGFDGLEPGGATWRFGTDMLVYSIGDDEWRAEPLPGPAVGAAVLCRPETDELYCFNGYVDTDGDGFFQQGVDRTTSRTLVFDAATGQWSERSAPPSSVSFAAAGLLGDVAVLVNGEVSEEGGEWRVLLTLLYDVIADDWTFGVEPPVESWGVGGVVYEGFLCVLNGNDGAHLTSSWSCRVGETWVEQDDELFMPRVRGGAAALDGHLYLVGGESSTHITAQVERWPSAEWPRPTEDAGPDGGVDADLDREAEPDGGPFAAAGGACACAAAGAPHLALLRLGALVGL